MEFWYRKARRNKYSYKENVGFQQRDRQDSQNLKTDTFYRPPVTSAQCFFGTEKYPDFGFVLNYEDDDYSQGFGQIKEDFRDFTKDDILQPYKFDNDFRLSEEGNDVGYNLNVFDLRYQKKIRNCSTNKGKL